MRDLDIPPVWLAGFLGLLWAQARVWPTPFLGRYGDVAGWVLVAVGLGLMLGAVIELGRARTAMMPRRAPSALVTSGVFALSRNPIYLGDVAVLLGAGLIWDAALVVVAVPVYAWMLHVRFVLPEEAGLARAFPAAFAAWRTRTGRWL